MNGIHEVMGSIPISSTKSSNNLARQRIGEAADLSISCPSWTEHPETEWDFLEPRASPRPDAQRALPAPDGRGLPSAANSVGGRARGEASSQLSRPGHPRDPHVALFHRSRGPAAGTATPSAGGGPTRQRLAPRTSPETLCRAPRAQRRCARGRGDSRLGSRSREGTLVQMTTRDATAGEGPLRGPRGGWARGASRTTKRPRSHMRTAR